MTDAMTLRADERQQQAVDTLSAEAASYRGGVKFDGHQIEVAVRAMLAFAALSRPSVDREAVARIIAPDGFRGEPGSITWEDRSMRRGLALAKADAILALIAGEGK